MNWRRSKSCFDQQFTALSKFTKVLAFFLPERVLSSVTRILFSVLPYGLSQNRRGCSKQTHLSFLRAAGGAGAAEGEDLLHLTLSYTEFLTLSEERMERRSVIVNICENNTTKRTQTLRKNRLPLSRLCRVIHS